VEVDGGKWFYYWDRSGDGTNENYGTKNNGLDTVSFGQITELFSHDIHGNSPITPINVYDRSDQLVTQEKYISDVYRYAELNGVKVALPTLAGEGGAAMVPNGNNQVQPLTYLGVNEVNGLYDDYLAIWDGFNIREADGRTNKNGTPLGWKAGEYWSATHYEWNMGYKREPQFVNLSNGYVTDASIYSTDKKLNVALQVINPTMSASQFNSIQNGEIQINGKNIGLVGTASSSLQRANQLITAINLITSDTGVTASMDQLTGGLKLNASDGRNIEISILSASGVTEDSIGIALSGVQVGDRSVTTYRSTVNLSSTSAAGIDLQLTGNGETSTGLITSYVPATETIVTHESTSGTDIGGSISSVDISTTNGAMDSISSIDSAIAFIGQSRSYIGGYQNRLLSIYDNLTNRQLNLSISLSTIKDTNYAVETANLAKSQIIQKASIAMLAQANQMKQSVLALLK
jgi:flagellin-like hook-associated protein FlgL